MVSSSKQARPGRHEMTPAHKAALAAGRAEARAVKHYLELLEQMLPARRRRPRSDEQIATRLQEIDAAMASASALKRIHLHQERLSLESERLSASPEEEEAFARARDGFIKVAKSYGDRKGISWEAWRAAGVDAPTLREAGIPESSAARR